MSTIQGRDLITHYVFETQDYVESFKDQQFYSYIKILY